MRFVDRLRMLRSRGEANGRVIGFVGSQARGRASAFPAAASCLSNTRPKHARQDSGSWRAIPDKHDCFFRLEKKEGFMHDKACRFYMNRIMASFRDSKAKRSSQTDKTRSCRSYSHETHRVFMSFAFNNGWHCRFHEGELSKTPISRQFHFRDKRKVYEAARRGHAFSDATSVSQLNQAIAAGHGGIWLRLTDEQYSTLTSSGRTSS
jgi:hypothetical protein